MLITSIHPSGKPFFLLSLFLSLETALVYDAAIFGVYAIAIWHVSATGKPSTPSRWTHPHPSKSAVALPPLSSPAATAQLSDILFASSGVTVRWNTVDSVWIILLRIIILSSPIAAAYIKGLFFLTFCWWECKLAQPLRKPAGRCVKKLNLDYSWYRWTTLRYTPKGAEAGKLQRYLHICIYWSTTQTTRKWKETA